MTPEALRRRMAHGNIYRPEKIDAALGNYFRVGNLTALRELALLWLADKVDDQLDRYRAEHHIAATWEARERVVVALTGGPEGDTLIRRGGADRRPDARAPTCWPCTSAAATGWHGADPANLARQRVLVESARRHLPPGRRRPTSRPRCSTSPAASTPPSWCSAPAAAGGSAQLFSPRRRR